MVRACVLWAVVRASVLCALGCAWHALALCAHPSGGRGGFARAHAMPAAMLNSQTWCSGRAARMARGEGGRGVARQSGAASGCSACSVVLRAVHARRVMHRAAACRWLINENQEMSWMTTCLWVWRIAAAAVTGWSAASSRVPGLFSFGFQEYTCMVRMHGAPLHTLRLPACCVESSKNFEVRTCLVNGAWKCHRDQHTLQR